MKIKLIIILSIAFYSVNAQDYRFGKVSEEELTLNKTEKTANLSDATVLYREFEIKYNYVQDEGFKKFTHVFERIKINKPEGFKWGTISKKLYTENAKKEEHIKDINAVTYNLVNGKIEKTKLKKRDIYNKDINEYWKEYIFTMPNLRVGAVVEFEYTVDSPLLDFGKHIFQYDIPIKKFKYEIRVPEYFNLTQNINTKASFLPQVSSEKVYRTILISYYNSLANGSAAVQTKFTKDNLVEKNIDIYENIYKSELENIPALKQEAFVDNIENYRAYIDWEIVSIRDFNNQIIDYSTTWESVAKTIYQSPNFGLQLEKDNYYEEDLNQLISTSSSEKEKINTIFNYVKNKVKWDGMLGYYTNDGVKKAYQNNSGNVSEVNLILVSMLKKAGLTAYPVLVSTRGNGIPISPTLDGFNYVIALVKSNNSQFFLDATAYNSTENILPERVLNWNGSVMSENGNSTTVILRPTVISSELNQVNINFNENKIVNGSISQRLTNYSAQNFRNVFGGLSTQSLVSQIQNDKNIDVENLEVENIKKLYKPIEIKYDFKTIQPFEEIGGNIYYAVKDCVNFNFEDYIQDDRVFPLDLIYPTSKKFFVTINVPDGYEVDFVPNNEKLVWSEKDAQFLYLVKNNQSSIQIILELTLNKTYITPENYPDFKKFVALSNKKIEEAIVLKRIN